MTRPRACARSRWYTFSVDNWKRPQHEIRTAGQHRLSNFLLWQAAYAELLFVDTLWPDFGGEAFARCLQGHGQRVRRFGR